MIKRIVSLFVIVCLLLSLFCVTASAVDIYEIDKSAVLMSSAPLSVSDSGISTAAVETSDLDTYLKYNGDTVADYLWAINYFLTGNNYALTKSPTLATMFSNLLNLFNVSTNGSVGYYIKSTFDFLDDSLSSNGLYLGSNGNSSSAYSTSIGDYVRNGFLGLSTNIKAVTTAIQSLDFNDYSSILSSIYSSVDGLESGLTSANTAIGGVTTAVNNVRTAVNDVVSGLSTVNTSVGIVNSSVTDGFTSLRNFLAGYFTFSSGSTILGSSGYSSTLSGNYTYQSTVRDGFLGLRNFLYNQIVLPVGTEFLSGSGTTASRQSDTFLNYYFRSGFLGLSSNIKGSETDNIYTSILYDNNNTTSSVNSTGLGPLLNTQLSNIGENLGHLAYIFASDDDIKLKQDSQPLVDATDSFFDDSDTKVKVSANNIGSLKNVGGDFLDIVDTGADVGDAISIVTNANSFRWFTAQTAADIDSVGTAVISYEESTYDRLHREFNEIYFPDRVGGGN